MSNDLTEEEIGFQIGFDRAKYGVCRQDLEVMGERAVRDELNTGKYGYAGLDSYNFVFAWLANKDFVRIEETAATAKAACAAATAAAVSAAASARHANHTKYIAIGIAIASTIISIIALFIKK